MLYQLLDWHFGKLKQAQVDFVAIEFVLNRRFLGGLHYDVAKTIFSAFKNNSQYNIVIGSLGLCVKLVRRHVSQTCFTANPPPGCEHHLALSRGTRTRETLDAR